MKKLIIIALVIAIITGFAVYFYANSLVVRYKVQTVPCVVAAQRIPKNTYIAPGLIQIKQLPLDAVNALDARSADDVVGRIAKEDFELNEQILTTKISEPGDQKSGLSYEIKEGYRALTIKTDEIIGVGGYINVGDRVDIAAVLIARKGNTQGLISKIIAENVEVLKIGARIDTSTAAGSSQNTSVTVAVTTKDLMQVNYSLSEGKYRLVLRSVLDKKTGDSPDYIP